MKERVLQGQLFRVDMAYGRMPVVINGFLHGAQQQSRAHAGTVQQGYPAKPGIFGFPATQPFPAEGQYHQQGRQYYHQKTENEVIGTEYLQYPGVCAV